MNSQTQALSLNELAELETAPDSFELEIHGCTQKGSGYVTLHSTPDCERIAIEASLADVETFVWQGGVKDIGARLQDRNLNRVSVCDACVKIPQSLVTALTISLRRAGGEDLELKLAAKLMDSHPVSWESWAKAIFEKDADQIREEALKRRGASLDEPQKVVHMHCVSALNEAELIARCGAYSLLNGGTQMLALIPESCTRTGWPSVWRHSVFADFVGVSVQEFKIMAALWAEDPPTHASDSARRWHLNELLETARLCES